MSAAVALPVLLAFGAAVGACIPRAWLELLIGDPE